MKRWQKALLAFGLVLVPTLALTQTAVSPVRTFTCTAGQYTTGLAGTGVFTCSGFGEVKGTARTISGTSDTIVSSDCGKTLIFTNAAAITLTTLASIVSGTDTCAIAVLQNGIGQVTIANGAGATQVSANSWTKTRAQYSILGLFIEPNNPSQYNIMGDGAL